MKLKHPQEMPDDDLFCLGFIYVSKDSDPKFVPYWTHRAAEHLEFYHIMDPASVTQVLISINYEKFRSESIEALKSLEE